MTKIKEIRDIINQAWNVKHGATGLYRSFKESVDNEASRITNSDKFTPAGKQALIGKLKERKTAEVMQLAKSQIDLYSEYLNKARKEADKVAYAKLTPVDKVKEERFDKKFNELKTQIMLAEPEVGAELLKEFVNATDEEYLVDKIRAEFSSTIAPIIGNADSELRTSLNKLFENTKRKARGAEALEAEKLIEHIEDMKQSRFFDLIVEENAKSLGKQASMYINRPDEYFAANPEHANMKTEMKSMDEVLLEAEHEAY